MRSAACCRTPAGNAARVRAKRNLLAVARHSQRSVISALISTIFVQPDGDAARGQLRAVVDQLERVAPQVAARLAAMEDDLLAYTAFPPVHWSKISSTNPISVNRPEGSVIERLNRELKRGTDVVQIFPDPESVIRLVGALLVEVNDELVAAPRRYMAASTLTPLLTDPDHALTSLPAAPRT